MAQSYTKSHHVTNNPTLQFVLQYLVLNALYPNCASKLPNTHPLAERGLQFVTILQQLAYFMQKLPVTSRVAVVFGNRT